MHVLNFTDEFLVWSFREMKSIAGEHDSRRPAGRGRGIQSECSTRVRDFWSWRTSASSAAGQGWWMDLRHAEENDSRLIYRQVHLSGPFPPFPTVFVTLIENLIVPPYQLSRRSIDIEWDCSSNWSNRVTLDLKSAFHTYRFRTVAKYFWTLTRSINFDQSFLIAKFLQS